MSVSLQDLIKRAREEAQKQALSGLTPISPVEAPSLPISQMQDTIRAYVQAHEAARRVSQQATVPTQPSPGARSLRGEGIALNDPITAQEVRGLRPEAQKILQGMTLEDISMSLHQLTPWQREAAESQAAGWGDVQASIGGALKWTGAETTGQKLIEHAAPLQARGPTDLPDYTWKDILNPRFWSTTVARSQPFTLALLPVGILGQYAAGATGLTGLAAKGGAVLAAKAAGMGAFGKAVVGGLAKFVAGAGGSIGAGALSSVAESAMEAGGTYNDALAMGMSEEEADRAANATFKKNMALLGITNTLEWATGVAKIPGMDRLMATTGGKMAAPIVRVGITGLTEAAEEGYQEWAQASSLGKPFSLDSSETRQAMMAGFAMGGGQSMIGVAQDMATLVRDKTVEKMSPERKTQLAQSVAEKVRNGEPEQQALTEALDEVAQTEDGKEAIEAAVREVADSHAKAAGVPEAPAAPQVPQVEVKVPTQGERAEIKVGQVVYHPTSGDALTVTDATDPALLVVQNSNGTTFKIGKGAVSLTPPTTQEPTTPPSRTEPELIMPSALTEPTPVEVSPPPPGDSPSKAEIARPGASEDVSQVSVPAKPVEAGVEADKPQTKEEMLEILRDFFSQDSEPPKETEAKTEAKAVQAKEPWQMTRAEFGIDLGSELTGQARSIAHLRAVERALSDGKSVPAEVLAEYPDLAPKKAAASGAPEEKTGDAKGAMRTQAELRQDEWEGRTWYNIKNQDEVNAAIKQAAEMKDAGLLPEVPVEHYFGMNVSLPASPFPGISFRGARVEEYESFLKTDRTGSFWTGNPSRAFAGQSTDRVIFAAKERESYDPIHHPEDNGVRTKDEVYAVWQWASDEDVYKGINGWKIIWKNPDFDLARLDTSDKPMPKEESLAKTPAQTAREEWERKHAEAKKAKAASEAVPKKVITRIPEKADSRWKAWRKLLTSIDSTKKDGYAFRGDWLTVGAKDELTVGSIAMFWDLTGSRKNQYPHARVVELTADGTWKTVTDEKGKLESTENSWALDLRDRVAAILEARKPLKSEAEQPQFEYPKTLTPAARIGDWVASQLREGKSFTPQALFREVASVYGGTMSEGKFTVKDAYDLMELGVNKRLVEMALPIGEGVTAQQAAESIRRIEEEVLSKIPTETKRTQESDEFQQFSTPPNIAYTAAWIANFQAADTVLEPSAGIGGLAVWAKAVGVREVVVNELSSRRATILKEMGFDRLYTENAEQLNNILPKDVKPTAIIMNPPFSATAGRMEGARNTKFAEAHLEQALKRLQPDGRLVTIVGRGMADGSPSFRDWWKKIKGEYNVRANVAIDGKNYKKYGTTFDVQLVVIDKSGPTPQDGTFVGHFEDLAEVVRALEEIKNDRARPVEQLAGEPTGEAIPPEGGGEGRPEPAVSPPTDRVGAGVRKDSPSAPGVSEPGGRVSEPPRTLDAQEGGMDAKPSPERGPRRRGSSGEVAEPSGVSEAEVAGGREPVRSGLPGERTGQPSETPEGAVESTAESEIKVGDTVYSTADGLPLTVIKVNAKDPSLITVRNAEGADFKIVRGQVTKDATTVTSRNGPNTPEIAVESRGETQFGEEVLTGDESSPVYSRYVPQKIKVEGAKEHPSALSESAAMAAVVPIDPTYTPDLPKSLIEKGDLSIAQLEPIVYAGQAHEQMLPGEKRRGYFIGDGTGVGKGREVAGIILDNMRRGRKKAVWISKNMKLLEDAVRDWTDLGGKKTDILPLSKVKLGTEVKLDRGILYVPYDTLKTGLSASKGEIKKTEGKQARLDQIVEWFGKDYDGAVIFDEAHMMQNCLPLKGVRGVKQPAARALAGVELQRLLPNARVVYSSATGATDPANLAYADRLGLWGEGTPFPKAENFVTQISAGGLAAMELVARDMKAMGSYISRALSYEGCTYDTLEHQLTPQQTEIYDTLARSWQVVLQNVNEALETTGQKSDGQARGNAMAQFWSSQQRFFNQILTATQMPSVIKSVEKDMADGKSVVMQLVNTNQAIQERQLAELEEDQDLEDLDMTPRDILLQYLDRSFPTQQYEDYVDEYGNTRSRPVTDSQGNPVMNQEALAAKEKLMQEVGMIKVPDGPLEIILDHFGVENVAEVTGRTRRVVRKLDKSGEMRRVQESWGERQCLADIESFRADKKRVLVFSEAGGTGQSYHADPKTKNKRPRAHYVIQPGWRADVCVQGFGRTHRSNEASQPHYRLVTTNLKGQKRFISTIARRLDQLGALTKGQRQTGSQGLFSASDNLEGASAGDALMMFYQDLNAGEITGLNGTEMFKKMGLEKLVDEHGNLTTDPKDLRDVPKFLNRILSLESSVQNQVFDEFDARLRRKIDQAIAAGNLDVGLEDFKADKIELAEERTVFTDQRTKAETKYLGLDVYHKVKTNDFDIVLELSKKAKGFKGFFRNTRSGNVYAFFPAQDKTLYTGEVVKQYRQVSQREGDANRITDEEFKKGNWEVLSEEEARTAWGEALAKTPEFKKERLHLITGTVLPIWDRLPGGHQKVYRVKAESGNQFLGRKLDEREVDITLQRLGASRAKQMLTPAQMLDKVLGDNAIIHLSNGWRIVRRKVSGETRLEILGHDFYSYRHELDKAGAFSERINWETRYFVPVGETGTKVFEALTKYRPVSSVDMPEAMSTERRQAVRNVEAAASGGDALADLESIEAELESELDSQIGRSTDLRIVPEAVAKAFTTPARRDVDGFFIENDEIRRRWQEANGVKTLATKDKLKAAWEDFYRKLTREFEFLPRTAEFAEMRTKLLALLKQPDVQNMQTLTVLEGIVKPIVKDDVKWALFEGGVVFNDLQHELDAGHDLPYKMTKEQFVEIKETLDKEIAKHPDVQQAITERKGVWKALVRAYVNAMEVIGFHVEQRFLDENGNYREDYFHHQVLEHVNADYGRYVQGMGQAISTPTGRGWLKKRKGSSGDINRNYVQAEFEVMAQMMFDIQKAKFISLIQSPKYNIIEECRRAAKKANEASIQALIMVEKAGYAKAHPRAENLVSDTETALNKMKGRIAWAFGQLRTMAEGGSLWDGERHEFARVVKGLASAQDIDVEPTMQDRTFEYLAALKNSENEGSMQAATILKNVSERRQFIRETLDDGYKTWEDVIPEGYAAWQPREGNVFYMTSSIPEKIAEEIAAGLLDAMDIEPEQVKRIMAVGGARPSYVIKEEIALTMERPTRVKSQEPVAKLTREMVQAWKAHQILGPHRFLKSQLRNVSGDADAAFVGNPSTFTKSRQAFEELYRVFVKGAPIQGDLKRFFQRGLFQASMTVQDLGDVNQYRAFRHLVESKGGLASLSERAWRKYWDFAHTTANFREAILRYAACLDYLEQMKGNEEGRPKNFGASIPEEIMAIPDIYDRAYTLANQLLGAYDQVSVVGQMLADSLMPFWRWQEVNFTRYIQLYKNALSDGRTGEVAGRSAKMILKKSPMLAWKSAKFAAKAGLLWAMLQAYNMILWRDEEEELSEDVRGRPHIVLGRNPDGSVRYFDRLGAVGDFIEWFSMDAPQQVVSDWLSGRITLREALINMAKAPVNKVWQSAAWLKLAAESFLGVKTFPDVFDARPIRDKWLYLFEQMGLGEEYKMLAGLPHRSYLDRVQNLLVYVDDPGEGSYYDTLDTKRQFLKKLGKATEFTGTISPKSNALYNLKLGLRYNDQDAVEKYLSEYIWLGGTVQGLKTSLRNMDPLHGLSQAEKQVFITEWLDDAGRERLEQAIRFYQTVLLGRKREAEEDKE